MKYILILIFFALSVSGCRKTDDSSKLFTTKPDTAKAATPLLTQDVQWRTHFQGSYYSDSLGYHYDTSRHFYTDVKSTGLTEIVGGFQYYTYTGNVIAYESNRFAFDLPVVIYLRRNASGDSIYMNFRAYATSYDMPIWSAGVKVGDTVMRGFRYGVIQKPDSILLGGSYFMLYRAWVPSNNKTYFYSAAGIGWQHGLIPHAFPFSGNGGRIKEMDFKYKNDSVHFDYDIQF